VFGFSVSQLALQLNLPHTPDDLVGHPVRYVLYFGTFAAIAGFWLAFHRMLSSAFRPAKVDVLLVMIYLAFIGLVPYTLYANTHLAGSTGGTIGLAAYLIDGTVLATVSSVLRWRNLVRGFALLDDAERLREWRSTVVVSATSVVLAVCIALDLAFGVQVGGPACTLVAVAAALSRRLTRLPPRAWLRVPQRAAAAPAASANVAEA
jgi:uncharacterized membrane protein